MRIKELCEERGITQAELANAVETSQRNIGRWENNENEPSYSQIIKLADFFGCSVDYLVGREDDFGNVTVAPTFPKGLDSEEEELIKNFRRLNIYQREALFLQAKIMADDTAKK